MGTPRVERGSPELTGPGRVVCVAGHNVTRIPDAGVLSLVRPELDSLDASSHIRLMCLLHFVSRALHFWPLQGVQLALLLVSSTQRRPGRVGACLCFCYHCIESLIWVFSMGGVVGDTPHLHASGAS